MGTDEHDFLRKISTRDLGDNIGRAHLRQITRGHPQSNADFTRGAVFELRDLALEVVGIRVRDCHRRNARRADVVGQRAGVGDAIIAGADGANHDTDRAERSRDRGALGARAHGLAVAAAIACALHAAIEEHNLSSHRTLGECLQRRDVAHHDDGRDDARVRCADAAAEGECDHVLREGREHIEACLAAHPLRHDHFGRADVTEFELGEFAARPRDRSEIARRARKAGAYFGRQRFEQLISEIGAQRLFAQADGALQHLTRQRDRWWRRRCGFGRRARGTRRRRWVLCERTERE